MIFSKNMSWFPNQLAVQKDSVPRMVIVLDIVDIKIRRFILSDGKYFIQASFEKDGFFKMVGNFSSLTLDLKGGIILIQRYEFTYNDDIMELFVKESIYLGEGSINYDTIDFNRNMCKVIPLKPALDNIKRSRKCIEECIRNEKCGISDRNTTVNYNKNMDLDKHLVGNNNEHYIRENLIKSIGNNRNIIKEQLIHDRNTTVFNSKGVVKGKPVNDNDFFKIENDINVDIKPLDKSKVVKFLIKNRMKNSLTSETQNDYIAGVYSPDKNDLNAPSPAKENFENSNAEKEDINDPVFKIKPSSCIQDDYLSKNTFNKSLQIIKEAPSLTSQFTLNQLEQMGLISHQAGKPSLKDQTLDHYDSLNAFHIGPTDLETSVLSFCNDPIKYSIDDETILTEELKSSSEANIFNGNNISDIESSLVATAGVSNVNSGIITNSFIESISRKVESSLISVDLADPRNMILRFDQNNSLSKNDACSIPSSYLSKELFHESPAKIKPTINPMNITQILSYSIDLGNNIDFNSENSNFTTASILNSLSIDRYVEYSKSDSCSSPLSDSTNIQPKKIKINRKFVIESQAIDEHGIQEICFNRCDQKSRPRSRKKRDNQKVKKKSEVFPKKVAIQSCSYLQNQVVNNDGSKFRKPIIPVRRFFDSQDEKVPRYFLNSMIGNIKKASLSCSKDPKILKNKKRNTPISGTNILTVKPVPSSNDYIIDIPEYRIYKIAFIKRKNARMRGSEASGSLINFFSPNASRKISYKKPTSCVTTFLSFCKVKDKFRIAADICKEEGKENETEFNPDIFNTYDANFSPICLEPKNISSEGNWSLPKNDLCSLNPNDFKMLTKSIFVGCQEKTIYSQTTLIGSMELNNDNHKNCKYMGYDYAVSDGLYTNTNKLIDSQDTKTVSLVNSTRAFSSLEIQPCNNNPADICLARLINIPETQVNFKPRRQYKAIDFNKKPCCIKNTNLKRLDESQCLIYNDKLPTMSPIYEDSSQLNLLNRGLSIETAISVAPEQCNTLYYPNKGCDMFLKDFSNDFRNLGKCLHSTVVSQNSEKYASKDEFRDLEFLKYREMIEHKNANNIKESIDQVSPEMNLHKTHSFMINRNVRNLISDNHFPSLEDCSRPIIDAGYNTQAAKNKALEFCCNRKENKFIDPLKGHVTAYTFEKSGQMQIFDSGNTKRIEGSMVNSLDNLGLDGALVRSPCDQNLKPLKNDSHANSLQCISNKLKASLDPRNNFLDQKSKLLNPDKAVVPAKENIFDFEIPYESFESFSDSNSYFDFNITDL